MRILQIVPDLSNGDGISNVLIKYMRSFSDGEIIFDFMCFNSNPKNKEKNYFKKEIEKRGGKVFYISSPSNPISFFKEWNLFCKNNFGNYKYLENNVIFLGVFFKDARKRLGVNKVITHTHVTKFGDNIFSNIRNKIFYYATGAPLGEVLFSSSKLAGKRMFKNKIYKKPWYVINNAFKVQDYAFDSQKRAKIRKDMNWENKFVIGHIGRFTSQKNHVFIIKLFKKYHDVNKKSILVLVGDGKLKKKIIKQVKMENLQDYVYFLGLRNDIPDLLQGFDLFLFPSKFEGLGLSVVEAQISGLPCLISDTIPEEANIAQCSVVSLKNDSNDWLHQLKKLQCKKRKINGVSLAKQSGFDIYSESQKLYKIYNEIGDRYD